MLLGSQDYSYTIGQGLCNPIWFDNRLNTNEDKLTISKLDCCHIQGCIDINLAKAARTMRLGLQPPVEYTSVEEAIFDFSPGKVVQNLARTAEEGRGNVILRREHPRVLKCADNMENVMCNSMRLVPSSEGFSIGLGYNQSDDFSLHSEALSTFSNIFLRHDIKL